MEKFMPFSNAEEFMAWFDANCADCPLDGESEGKWCEYLSDLFNIESPTIRDTWKTIGGDERSWENGIPVLDWACKVKEAL